MKRKVIAFLTAAMLLAGTVLPGTGVWAEEELELTVSTGESVLTKGEENGLGSILDQMNSNNASIMEALGKKDWDALAKSVKMTGKWRDDLVSVAQTQVGYTAEANGDTIYTQWAGAPAGTAWDALFVNWVAEKAGLSEKEFPRGNSYAGLTEQMRKVGAVKEISRANYPNTGDVALLKVKGVELVGVIAHVSNGYAAVIHANSQGMVTRETYLVDGNEFQAYVDLNVLMERAGVEIGKGGDVPVIPEGGVAAWTNTNAVYMRKEPTTASKSVTTVKSNGTALLVTSAEMQEDGYIWYGVEYKQYKGYIRGDLLKVDMTAVTVEATATPAPAATAEPTAIPGCAVCVSEAGNILLPVDCCYAHLNALGADVASQFMSALKEVDMNTWELYVKCHDAHVNAGAQAIIPLGGLTVQERVVNIEVKKALVGEAVTISFDIYGATGYQWFKVETVNGVVSNGVVGTPIEGATDAELTAYAKPGEELSYYCVATLPLGNGATVTMTSKLTTLTVSDTPIVVEAILGEEINFTFEYLGADHYQWFMVDPAKNVADDVESQDASATSIARFTTYANTNDAGKYFYCEAQDKEGTVLATSSIFMYNVRTDDDVLCKYVDELVNMTRTERYDIMTTTWNVDGLAERVMEHWENHKYEKDEENESNKTHSDDYPSLLCTCADPMKAPFEGGHTSGCGWYIPPVDFTEPTEPRTIELEVPYGLRMQQACDISDGIKYQLYYEGILVYESDDRFLYFEGADEDRVYLCNVTLADHSIVPLTYVVKSTAINTVDTYVGLISKNCATEIGVEIYDYDEYAVYELMTQKWPGKKISVFDFAAGGYVEKELVQAVFKSWMDFHLDGEDGMFCTCCYDGEKLSDKIMLHPDALHKKGVCAWYEDPKEVEAGGITVSGALPDGVTLKAAEVTPNRSVLAKMENMAELASTASIKAFDITPTLDGAKWQPAKGASVMVTIPDAYDPTMENPVVYVFHLLVGEDEIKDGYGYEKLSSAHFGGVTLNNGDITFEIDGFSTFYVASINNQCALCEENFVCVYSQLLSWGTSERYAELNKLTTSSFESFLRDYEKHLAAGEIDILCRCGENSRPLSPDAENHGDTCPWGEGITYYTNVLLADTMTLTAPSVGMWTIEGSAEVLANAASLTVVAGVEPVRYLWTGDNGETSVYVVAAQTTVLDAYYLRLLEYVTDQSTDPYVFDQNAIYDYMTSADKWNQVIGTDDSGTPVTLAETIVLFWLDTHWAEESAMLCKCCIDELGYVSDEIVRHPNALHENGCGWGADVLEDEETGITVTGDIPAGVVLVVTEAQGEQPEMDFDHFETYWNPPMVTGYDISLKLDDADYELPEGTTVTVTIPNVWSIGMTDPVVDVYHVTDNGEVVYLTSFDDSVLLNEEGGISFETGGFSDYWVASGSISLSALSNGGSHTVYMAPGSIATVSVGNSYSNVTGTVSPTSGVVTMSRSNRTFTITAATTAEIGSEATISFSWGSSRATVYVKIVSADEVEKGQYLTKFTSTTYPVYLAIRQDGNLPGEPSVQGNSGYSFFNGSYTTGNGSTFATTANGIIDTAILDHDKFFYTSVDGTQTIGMVDATGENIRTMVSGVDWDRLLTAAASRGNVTATDGTRVTSSNVDDYKIVPYVIKLQETEGTGWHIDCAIMPKADVMLSYDINIPAGLVIDTRNVGVPNNETGKAPATFTVGSVNGLTTITDSDGSHPNSIKVIDPNDSSKSYTFTFLGWNTKEDGTGDWYDPRDSITIEENTVLYAIWSANPAIGTGNLAIKKIVAVAEGETIDENQEFTFTVNINDAAGNTSTDAYDYTIYGANSVAIPNGSGTIRNGGMIRLKHGQYVVIYDLPAVSNTEENPAPNVTVTETAVDGYAASWDGGTTESPMTSIAIQDGRRSEVTCTNTKAPSKGSLTIKKEGATVDDSFIFTVTGEGVDMQVVIKGTGSVTIADLPLGTYTVTEDTDWSWRYTQQSVAGLTDGKVLVDADGTTVTFTNTKTNNQWLSDESSIINFDDENQ